MDPFMMYYRCSLSRADVTRINVANSPALHLHFKHRFIRFSPSHRRPMDVFPPTNATSLSFPASQHCVTHPTEAFCYVSTLLWSQGIVLDESEVREIASCLLLCSLEQGRGSIVVLVNLTIWSTDDFTEISEDAMRSMFLEDSADGFRSQRSDETLMFDAESSNSNSNSNSNLSDETLIFDDVSSVNPKLVELERTTVKDGSCAICLDEFDEGGSVSRTPCAHVFHDDCIGKWMRKKKKKPNCPLCRSHLAG